MSHRDLRNIALRMDSYKRLRKYSQGPPDSFNTVVERLLDFREKHAHCANVKEEELITE